MKNTLIRLFGRAASALPANTAPSQDALHPVLKRLSEYEGAVFLRTKGNKAHFGISYSDRCHRDFPAKELPNLLETFRHDRSLFVDLKTFGISEIQIPTDIDFDVEGTRFTEIVDTKPLHRGYVSCNVGYPAYHVTKDKVLTDVIIEVYDKLVTEFEKAVQGTPRNILTAVVREFDPR